MGIHLGISIFITYCSYVHVRSILYTKRLRRLLNDVRTYTSFSLFDSRSLTAVAKRSRVERAIPSSSTVVAVDNSSTVCDVYIKVCSESSRILAINTSTETIDNIKIAHEIRI